jgi:arabinofuranosyltransferase
MSPGRLTPVTALDEAAGPVALMDEAPPSVGRRRWPTVPRWDSWLTAVPLLFLLVQAWQRRWMADDGLIHLRVVENVLAGHGFVFNAGERVEASTSVLWVALLSLVRAPKLIDLEVLAVLTGLAGTVAGLFLAMRGAAALWRPYGERSLLLPAGAVVVAVLPPMWDFATSGLETGLVFFWLGLAFHLLARLAPAAEPDRRQFRVAAVVISAGPLIRPDLALFTGAFLLALLVLARRDESRWVPPLLRLALLGSAVPFAYQIFRMGYYGALVPTTALAKEASRSWWSQGRLYLSDFLGTYWLVIPLGIAAAFLGFGAHHWIGRRDTRLLVVAAAPVVAGLADGLYVVRVGGDFMHARLLLPALFAVLMPVAVVQARSWWRGAAALLIVPWAVVCFIQLRLEYVVGPAGIADERAFYSISTDRRNPVQVNDYARMILHADGQEARRLHREPGRLLGWRTDRELPVYTSMPLRSGLPFRTAFIASNLGITGVLAGPSVHIIDPSGLADPFASRLILAERGRPGHEKALPLPWVIARFGDPATVPQHVDAAAVDAVRRALGCGALAELEAATTDRLTPARFVRNIRAAIRLRELRIPSDPGAADARFCGARQSGP